MRPPFRKVLIANRGAIACRIIRTLARMGVASVAVYSEADRHAMHVARASEAVAIGPAPAALSYLNVEAILAAARTTGAEAIHPGYGFLSENPDFAEACGAAGIVFIGPKPDADARLRVEAQGARARPCRRRAARPGLGALARSRSRTRRGRAHRLSGDAEEHRREAAASGSSSSRRTRSLRRSIESVGRLARNNFKDAGLFLEKYVARGRHIEVQIFGDGKGRVVALGERDCSAQRRHQKVVEETPAPGLSEATRAALWETARPARPVGRLRERGHRRVPLRQRHGRLLLPRGQHAPPGRARRDGGGHRHRPRRMDGAPGCGRDAPPRSGAGQAAGRLDPGAALRRGPRAGLPAERGAAHPCRVAAGRRASRHGSRPEARSRPSTIPCWRRSSRKAQRATEALEKLRRALDANRDRRPRDEPRLPPPARRLRGPRQGRDADRHARDIFLRRADHRGAFPRDADDHPGLARPRRLLAGRRAALGPHGSPLLPPREPQSRQ